MKRIVLYCRVSTEEQAAIKEGSLISQEQRLREYVERRNGSELWGKIVAVFVEPGRSAKDTNRPELQKMLLGVKQGLFDLILVTEISRLSRSTLDFCNLLELFKKHRCQILSLREQFDTTTAAGEMMMHMLMNFAQFERQQTGERLRANFTARKKRGLRNGGAAPLGYTFDKDHKGKLKVLEEEARVVRECFQTFLTEGSLSAACKSLNQRGLSPKRIREGGGLPRVGSKTFMVHSLRHILTNPVYIAKVSVNENGKTVLFPAQWPLIIEQSVFEAVRERLSKNKDRFKPDTYKRHPYVLSGILECGLCGQALVGKSAHGRNGKHFYYAHGSQIRRNSVTKNPGCHCSIGSLKAIPLEQTMMRRLNALIGQPEVVSVFLEKAREDQNTSAIERRIKDQKQLIDENQEKIEKVLSHLESLPTGSRAHSLYDRLTQLEEKKKKLQEDLNRLETELLTQIEIIDPEAYVGFLKRLTSHLEEASPQMQRRLIRSVIQKIIVHQDQIEAYYFAAKDTVERNWGLLERDPSAPSGPLDDGRMDSRFRGNDRKNFISGSNTLTKNRDLYKNHPPHRAFDSFILFPPLPTYLKTESY
ncbi:MAG: recombinase family protein [Deltaproteobacteria bacterium]